MVAGRVHNPVFAAILLICWLVLPRSARAQGDLVIIVNAQTSLEGVSSKELAALYLGDSTSIGGVNLKPVSYVAGNPLRGFFETQVLKLTAEQFAERWRSKRFLGSFTKQPTAFKSAQAVKRFVAEERGTIGYISSTDVDDSVRTIGKVDGVPVGGHDYPLHFSK